MLANFLIGLREGLEAGLVAGILIAYLRKIGRRDVLPRLWIGVGAAVALSLGVGALLTWGPTGLSFQAQETLAGVLSILSVGLVTWMILWMARNARDLKGGLQTKMAAAIAGGGLGIVLLGFITVGREGVETALFIWANVNQSGVAVLSTIGAFLGIAAAIALSYLIFTGFVRINLSTFFTWTGLFLIVIAAGVFADGIGALQAAAVVPGVDNIAYSLATVIPPDSWYDTLLGGIFNFTPEPTWAQFIGWIFYSAVVSIAFFGSSRKRSEPANVASAKERVHAVV
jgi:high-affinity iron transporter